MTTKEFILQVYQGKLGRLDALSQSNDFTNGEKSKIKMLIDEIDEYRETTILCFRQAIEWRIDKQCNLPIKFNCTHFEYRLGNLDNITYILRDIDNKVKQYIEDYSIKDFFDYCNLDLVKDLYPDLCKSLNQLKTDLSDFIDNQNSMPSTEKKQAKGVWGLAARYNFIKDLEVIKRIELISNQTEIANAISQILGCSFDNAKKLKNGSYQVDETMEEQLERKQLFQLIEQHQVNKKG